jgi:hypothetical protein
MWDSRRRSTDLLSQVAMSPVMAETADGGLMDVVVGKRDLIVFPYFYLGSLV